MLISVVISCYNGVRHIPKCVDSFLKQTYREIEIILYDDASTDGTWCLLQQLACQYPKTIRAYHGEKNKGPGGGKNAGLQYARGEYAYIADCDDYVAETYLENLVKTAQREGLPDIVIGGFSKVDKDGNLKYQRYFFQRLYYDNGYNGKV